MARTAFGRFLQGLGKGAKANSMSGVARGLGDSIMGSVTGLVTGIMDKADDRRFTEEEKARYNVIRKELEIGLEKIDLERKKAEVEILELEAKIKISAMEMYKTDNELQKTFARGFLVGFFVLTIMLLALVGSILFFQYEVSEFVAMTVGAIWGIYTSVILTMKDFFFGGSQQDKERDGKLLDRVVDASASLPHQGSLRKKDKDFETAEAVG